MNIANNQEQKQLLCYWIQLQQDQMPLAPRAQTLCDLLAKHPKVSAAIYLRWQSESNIYQAESTHPLLPPGQADASNTTDSAIKQLLSAHSWISLEQIYQANTWLSSRLTRRGWKQGIAFSFALDSSTSGMLVLHTKEPAAALATELAILVTLLETTGLNANSTTPSYRAHNRDPHPSAICHLEGAITDVNFAFHSLAQQQQQSLEQCLPANHRALVNACVQQHRAIDNVEARVGNRLLQWTYIPLSPQQVLLRGQDVTEELTELKAAAKAQRLYRVITENTTDLISRHTLDGVFLDATPASWNLLGYWPEELRGTSTRDLFHPKDLAQLQQDAVADLQELGYHTMTYRVRHKDGHYLWFETASRAIRETYTGDVVEVVSVSRDITARVKAEENRRRLAEVVEANTDLVLFISLQGTVTYANKAARKALGLALEEFSSLATIFDTTTFSALQKTGWRHAVRRGYWTHEAQLYPASSSQPLPVSVVLLAHKSAGGERYFSLIMRDMTERALRESEQRQYQEERSHSARLIALGELASGIAHEMNQPLAAISNFAAATQRHLQQLEDPNGAIQEKVTKGLEHISHQAHHASEVIRRLRAFLRKGQRRLEPLSLPTVITDTLHLCAWELEREKITVEQLGLVEPPEIYADRTLLEQVLLNLIGNAIEANGLAHSGQPSRIILRTTLQDNKVVISVEDQGPGVDKDTLAMMFTPFFTRKEKGLGLGLSMSRSIIEGFGGDLSAENKPNNQGLVVHCTLPIAATPEETK